MQLLKNNFWFGPLLSGLLAFVSVGQINFYTSWLFYIPLFISISSVTPAVTFKKGFLFGFVLAAIGFFWMIPGAERFTGYSIFYGIGVFLVSVIFFSLYNAIVLYSFALVKTRNDKRVSLFLNSLLIASFICIGEKLMTYISRGFPWFDLHSGSGLADNLYAIQPASVFGVHILSFVVVMVNYIAAALIVKRSFAKLYLPAALVVGYLLFGVLLMKLFNQSVEKKQPFNIAILDENIPPDIKWDDNNGNLLVQRLLDLNKSAVALKPAVILWSESAIPWTYKKDDDLVNEILKITNPSKVTHIMGINTAITENEVFNSAYCILPGGNVAGRYDKQYLLALIEMPLNGFIMPFFSSKGFVAKNDVRHSAPLLTPYGKAGVLICNEAAVPAAASSMVKQGAEYLCNMSNDGWFNDTYIVRLHFHYARLRAVESRKDLAISCNNGYSGLIKASGDIEAMKRSEEPFVEMVTMEPNNHITLASKFPNLFILVCLLYLLTIIAINVANKYKSVKAK
ncbi:apolipoprotein N-acyltransferase [soil metagenome]